MLALPPPRPSLPQVVGLETVQASNNQPYPLPAVQARLALLESKGVRSVGLWDSPVPDEWIPLLKQWVAAGRAV